jgi:hypothetical protein
VSSSLSFSTRALVGKPRVPSSLDQASPTMVREPLSVRQVIYGGTRVGGRPA